MQPLPPCIVTAPVERVLSNQGDERRKLLTYFTLRLEGIIFSGVHVLLAPVEMTYGMREFCQELSLDPNQMQFIKRTVLLMHEHIRSHASQVMTGIHTSVPRTTSEHP